MCSDLRLEMGGCTEYARPESSRSTWSVPDLPVRETEPTKLLRALRTPLRLSARRQGPCCRSWLYLPEEPFDHAVGLGVFTRVRTCRSSGSSP